MTVPTHHDRRLAIQAKLSTLLEKGCERWQAHREGKTLRAFQRLGRNPKIRTFLDEEYKSAAYKAWCGFKHGAENPEDVGISTDFSVKCFMERLRRPGLTLGGGEVRWFEEKEIADFELEFKTFWSVEKLWIDRHKEKISHLNQFKMLGGEDLVKDWIGSGPDSYKEHLSWVRFMESQEFIKWTKLNITEPYYKNRYGVANANAQALVWGICSGASRRNKNLSTSETWLFEKTAPCLAVALNVAANTGGTFDRNLFEMVLEPMNWLSWTDGETFENALVHGPYGVDNSYELSSYVHRAQIRRSSWFGSISMGAMVVEYFNLIGVILAFQEETNTERAFHSRENPDGRQEKKFLATSLLNALDNLMWLRERILSNSGMADQLLSSARSKNYKDDPGEYNFRRYGDSLPNRLAYLASHRSGNFDGFKHTFEQVEVALETLEKPNRILEQQIGLMKEWGIGDEPLLSAKAHIICAQSWLSQGAYDSEESAESILKAKVALTDAPTLLAWGELYGVCEQYMRRRGNKIMAEKAVDGQEKLHQAALKHVDRSEEFSSRRSELEDAEMLPTKQQRSSYEEQIRQFLLREPPPLQRKKN